MIVESASEDEDPALEEGFFDHEESGEVLEGDCDQGDDLNDGLGSAFDDEEERSSSGEDSASDYIYEDDD